MSKWAHKTQYHLPQMIGLKQATSRAGSFREAPTSLPKRGKMVMVARKVPVCYVMAPGALLSKLGQMGSQHYFHQF